MRFLIASAAALAVLAAAPNALAAQKDRSSCFLASQVNGFNVVDDQTVDVSIGPKTVYRLTLFAPSQNIDWTQRIAIRTRGGGSWICSGMDAEIIVPGDIGMRNYPVTDVRKLTPEELAAPKKKKQP